MEERKLGESWSEWYENRQWNEPDADEPKRTFLLFALLGLAIFIGGLYLLLFLIGPRLALFHPTILLGAGVLIKAVCIVVALEFACEYGIAVRGKGVRLFPAGKNLLEVLAPLTIRLGETFGRSKDRMLNSFLKTHNSMVPEFNGSPVRLLLLFPRCLQNSDCKQKVVEDIANCKKCGRCVICHIRDLKEKGGCDVWVAGGGREARQIILKNKPKAIIAVACERELFSGLGQLDSIPVIAIANCRPEGPCLNTDVDFKKIEEAVKFFLKK